jgi:acetyl esterase/lipase
LGIAAAVLNYRVAPYRHPWPWTDASRAIRWIRYTAEELGIDANRVGILGFSAGGHLATSTGVYWDTGSKESADPVDRMISRPDLMVLCYPVISFGQYRHHGSMVNLIGEAPDPDLQHALSLETQVTSETAPAFIWHTADDAAVPVQNALGMAAALASRGVSMEVHIFPSGRHGLGLAYDEPQVGAWTGLCARWLKAQGVGT